MQTFTTKAAAFVAGVHQQTVIRWAEDGFVVPSVDRNKYEPRQYTLQDLAALSVAISAQKYGSPEHKVKEMVDVAQNSDKKQQRNAAIVAARSPVEMEEGFVIQYFFTDVRDSYQAESIKELKEEGRFLQQVSFYDALQGARKDLQKILDNKKFHEKIYGRSAR